MSNAKDMCGICVKCGEWTTVFEPCCNAPVMFEGSECCYEDYCEHCGEELEDDHVCSLTITKEIT